MELKQDIKSKYKTKKEVLIGPSWNWNFFQTKLVAFRASFNRTFMELKLSAGTSLLGAIGVLIGPSWNWNAILLRICQAVLGFNRTFMELKQGLGYDNTAKAVMF